VRTAKGRGLNSDVLAGNGAPPLAFPMAPTTASYLTGCLSASWSKFNPRAILGTFCDVPGRTSHFWMRLQSKREVVLGCNLRYRTAYLCTALGCNSASLLALQQLKGKQQPVWRQNTQIDRFSFTEPQDDVCCFVCSGSRKRVATF
jgi:hypothetical protein